MRATLSGRGAAKAPCSIRVSVRCPRRTVVLGREERVRALRGALVDDSTTAPARRGLITRGLERSRTLGSACSRPELDEASETARCDVRHLKRDRAERSYLHKLVLESSHRVAPGRGIRVARLLGIQRDEFGWCLFDLESLPAAS